MPLDPMRKTGSRAELVADLLDSAEGWHHFGKDKLSADSSAGAAALEDGAPSVRVGHTVYHVDEAGDTGHTGA